MDLNNYDYHFSDVSSHLYKRVCLSVHLSVRRLRLFKNLISRLRSCNESNDLYMYPVSPPTVMPEIQAICAKFTPCSKTIKTHRCPVGLVYFFCFSLCYHLDVSCTLASTYITNLLRLNMSASVYIKCPSQPHVFVFFVFV